MFDAEFGTSNAILRTVALKEAATDPLTLDFRSIYFYQVHAVVTNSDMVFNVDDIDFGHATIYESVKKTIKLSNESILPQKYGFVGLPNVSNFQILRK